MIIDVHTHIVPEHFPAVGNRAAGDRWPSMDHAEPGKANIMISGRNFRTVLDRCWNLPRRISEMPEQQIDKQVLSPLPELLMYAIEPQDGLDMARYLNETIARMMDEAPDRFYGLGSVPMQDVELAATELGRVKELGLQGVEIMTNINGKNLGEPEFRPFFKEAESVGAAIFVHAYRPTMADRYDHLAPSVGANSVGIPLEPALAGISLIWGGVMAECPNLRVYLSHGGGVLGQLLTRGDNSWIKRPVVKELLPKSPLEYARQFFYDDIAYNTTTIRYLIDMFGISQLMIGSDYPLIPPTDHPKGYRDQTPEEEFDDLGLNDEEREAMGSRNALRFLGYDA